MKTRRTAAQRLAEDRAALLAKMREIQEKLDAVDVKLTPEQERERDETDQSLGTIARALIAEDTKLKARFIAKAADVFRKNNRHRKWAERILGPLASSPVAQSNAKPDDAIEFAPSRSDKITAAC